MSTYIRLDLTCSVFSHHVVNLLIWALESWSFSVSHTHKPPLFILSNTQRHIFTVTYTHNLTGLHSLCFQTILPFKLFYEVLSTSVPFLFLFPSNRKKLGFLFCFLFFFLAHAQLSCIGVSTQFKINHLILNNMSVHWCCTLWIRCWPSSTPG